MSASLFGDVIVDIKDILRALQTYDQNKPTTQYDRPPGLPFPIAMPVPQRTPSHFATILLYEEPEEQRSTSSAVEDPYVQHKDDYLKSGGRYTQRLLTFTRAKATSFRKDLYRETSDSATSNDAPPWPPAPELVANPPNWGFTTTTSHNEKTSEDADMDSTESDNDWSPDVSSQSGSAINVFEVKGRDWDPESTSGSSSEHSRQETCDEDEDTCATGYFIGRDGSKWPMPPPECMPGGYLSTHPSPYERLGTCSPTPTTDATDSLSGYEAPTSADEDVVALEAIEGRVVWSAEGYDSRSSDTDSDEHEGFEDDQLGHASHYTPPPLSYSAGNSPASGFAPSPTAPSTPAPHCPSLADLGRQWYASFGKDLQPSPSSSSPDSYAPHMSLGPPSTTAPDSCWRPRIEEETRAGETMRKAHRRASEEQRYFLGRDGSAWPLPPPPPDASECGLWRPGRAVRVPRW